MKTYIKIELIKMPHASCMYEEGAPRIATEGSAGVDLRSSETVVIHPGQCIPVKTGLRLNMLEPGWCAIVAPKSGLGSKGLVLGNTLGLIDNDYQGEIICYMMNRKFGASPGGSIAIDQHMKFAQMFFIPYAIPVFNIVESFREETVRGQGGFGSTGVM